MAQFSLPWPGIAPGDGADAGPYTAMQWWERLVALFTCGGSVSTLDTDPDRYNLGVLARVGNLLAVTNPIANNIQIDTGAALVDGVIAYNDAALTLTIPLPVTNPRIDRIVLRKNYTSTTYDPAGDAGDEEVPAYTARITRIVGIESTTPTPPALTQDTSRGTYWDIPLAQFRISTAGVISALTDEREFAPGWDEDHHSPNVAYGMYHALYRVMVTDAIQADAAGNARGDYAIDLQKYRTDASQVASGDYSAISGGRENKASASNSAVSGGASNQATGQYTTIAGGHDNRAMSDSATVGGGRSNTASGEASTASGGDTNTASATYSTVGGGKLNMATATYSTVGGGDRSQATATAATVGGGSLVVAEGINSTVSGGQHNTAAGEASTVSGGSGNLASGTKSTVSGGFRNTASGAFAAVAGGDLCMASEDYAFAAGYHCTASGAASLAVGDTNVASGIRSVGLGNQANADKYGQIAVGNDGDYQMSWLMVRLTIQHLADSWYDLKIGSGGGDSLMTIPANTLWYFEAWVLGRGTASHVFTLKGAIQNIAGTTTLLVEDGVEIYPEAGTTFDVQAVADDVNDALVIQVCDTAAGGDVVSWAAKVGIMELKTT